MKKTNSRRFLLILLGMLTAFGPFITDMYLPCLPVMADGFQTSSSMIQLGLTTSMLGLAAGQIFFGPLSDKYGRRPPLLIAMWLFIISTILCLISPTVEWFIAFRFLQGIAGAGGIVISRSVATDLYAGQDLAKMLALIGAVNGIAPVAAPVIGGLLTDSVGWKGIFCVLLGLGCILLAACMRLRESLEEMKRLSGGVAATFRNFSSIIRHRRFLSYVLQMGFAQGILFGYIASSPFIIQQHYGFSALSFSICFGINAIAIGTGAALSVKFNSPEKCTLTGSIGMFVLAIAEGGVLFGEYDFWMYEIILFALLLTMGMTFTSSTTLAMDGERRKTGAASAFLGAVCFMFGGIVSPLVGLGNILTATGIIFMLCAGCSLWFGWQGMKTQKDK